MDNQVVIGKIYESFGKGYVPAILEHISDDAKWEHWEGTNSAQAKGVAPWSNVSRRIRAQYNARASSPTTTRASASSPDTTEAHEVVYSVSS